MNHHPTYRPRDMRSKYLGSTAYRLARMRGLDVMDSTCAQIDAAFGHAAEINSFKLATERFMLFGSEHPAIRARYKARAEMLRGVPLHTACHLVNEWHRRETFCAASGGGSRMSVLVLRELSLITRWMRAKGLACQFQTFINDILS